MRDLLDRYPGLVVVAIALSMLTIYFATLFLAWLAGGCCV